MFVNYTLQDIFGIILAFILYSLIFVFPGYVTGWMLDLFDFRKRTPIVQIIMAMTFSAMISPVVLFLAYRFTSSSFVIGMLAATALIAAGLFVFEYKKNGLRIWNNEYGKSALLFASLWLVLSILTLVDLQFGNRLYFSNNAYDLTTRVAVVDAITRTGVPPVNPSYYPDYSVLLNFLYYYWYVLGSLVDQMGGTLVSAYHAMIASISWAGILLFAALGTYLRVRDEASSSQTWKKSFIAIQLFAVSGLDFVMVVMIMANFRLEQGYMPFQGHIEGWNMPIMSWMNALAWVPHHLTAALACVIGMMLMMQAMKKNRFGRFVYTAMIGLAFASAFGLSVWVMFVFGIFWAVWVAFVLFQQRNYEQVLWMLLSGVFGILFSVPFIAGLLQSGGSSAGSGLPVSLYIRPFMLGDLLTFLSPFAKDVANFFFLPLNYLFELGFFFLIALVWYQEIYKKRRGSNPIYRVELILVVVSTIVLSFMRSTLIVINDLGIRGWLPMQFILVVWSADVIVEMTSARKWVTPGIFHGLNGPKSLGKVIGIMLVIGMLTTGLEFFTLRAWSPLIDLNVVGFPNKISPDTHLGERTYSARLAYDYLRDHVPPDAIVQSNPLELLDRPSGLYASHQMVISDRTPYGIPQDVYDNLVNGVGSIFADKAADWKRLDAECAQYSINVLIIKDTDPLWGDLSSMKMERPPLYENTYYALYSCGK